tara:strand:+ start:42291 stop:44453 length:2163 start_codon:yes stop_codon:yes gene_type:complete
VGARKTQKIQMFENFQEKTFDCGDGNVITIESGRLARQAHGSVVLKCGKTMILATVVSKYDADPKTDFLPLSVDYQEKFASVGRIPGGFLKREGRLSEYEILICRLVDRALRPMFPSDYHADTQVMVSLIASDENILPDNFAGFAASAAISVSDIPFDGPISEVRIARVDGKFIVNPKKDQLENSDVDLMIAGTKETLNMVEGEMDGISEDDMLEAMKIAHQVIQKQCDAQLDLAKALNGGQLPTKRTYDHELNDEALEKEVHEATYQSIYDAATNASSKNERAEAFDTILQDFKNTKGEVDDDTAFLIKKYFGKTKKKAVREMVLSTSQRLDGRKFDEVRQIESMVNYLPTAHGSAVFTRGETQSLTSVTFGSKLDEQMLDSPMNSGYNKFILHYNFPPFSTGEARPARGPGRREIGHGNLASRGLRKMLPDDVPYTIRIVSDILESNGSSSMATVCAGSMALMDSGIQLKSGISGIAMGMISDEDSGRYAILSDILGDEDHLGDMDFKVVGNRNGLYACQMDIKIKGLNYDILKEALLQARAGRLHVLDEMEKTIKEASNDFKDHAPRIVKFEVPKDKIGAIIGTGGKVIQELQKETNTTISIEEVDEQGVVEILSNNKDDINNAYTHIQNLIAEPEIGKEYTATVKSIKDFGAFVEYLPGKEGLLHISEISWKRLPSMEGVLEMGEQFQVKLTDIDKQGRVKLSRKVLLPKPERSEK